MKIELTKPELESLVNALDIAKYSALLWGGNHMEDELHERLTLLAKEVPLMPTVGRSKCEICTISTKELCKSFNVKPSKRVCHGLLKGTRYLTRDGKRLTPIENPQTEIGKKCPTCKDKILQWTATTNQYVCLECGHREPAQTGTGSLPKDNSLKEEQTDKEV